MKVSQLEVGDLNKSWMYVALTCFFEWVWVFGFNTANIWWHWVIVVGLIFVDFHFLTKACEELPTGTVYALFAGAGTIGTTIMDAIFFAGDLNLEKLIFIGILLLGVISLKLSDNQTA